MREIKYSWGTTEAERARAYPCDAVLPDHNQAYFRGVTIDANSAAIFRWLCQLRVAPYSYDWIDNLGRRSPQQLTPGLDHLASGQPFMKIFDLVDFETDSHVTLQLREPGLFPPLAVSYMIIPIDSKSCRLVAKLAVQIGSGYWYRCARLVLPWLDWIMMRRQLLNLKDLAERLGGAPE